MDRVTKLRGQAGGSNDSTLSDSLSNEGYTTANDSSKYFSLSEEDPSFDISPIKDVSLASAAARDPEKIDNDELISNITPTSEKNEMLEYKIGKQIEAANILSGGVDIFEDNNSYDGNELVIDDNVEIQDKPNTDLKLPDNNTLGLEFQKAEESDATLIDNEAVASKDTEVLLQIDGKNVNAIDIGNGLYLYRKEGQEELAAVQIIDDDQNQPSFKFLKVRENAEGNLEVYEEIEVPKEMPPNESKFATKKTSQGPVKQVNKTINEPTSSQAVEAKNYALETKTLELAAPIKEKDIEASKDTQNDIKAELNLNGETLKSNEKRKSPVIRSTPNKEVIPLTKTMVNLHLHPNRHLDNVKTIEVHTDNKHKQIESPTKNKNVEECKILPAVVTNDIELRTSDIVKDKIKESQETEKSVMPVGESKFPENKTVEETDQKIHVAKTEEPRQPLSNENIAISNKALEKTEQESINNDSKQEPVKNDVSSDLSSETSKNVTIKENIINDACVSADKTVEKPANDTIDKNEDQKNILLTSQNEVGLKTSKVELKPSELNKNLLNNEEQPLTEKQIKAESKISDFFNKHNKPKVHESEDNNAPVSTSICTVGKPSTIEIKSNNEEQTPASKLHNIDQSSSIDTLNANILKEEPPKEKAFNTNETTIKIKEATTELLASDKLREKDFTPDVKTNLNMPQESKLDKINKCTEQKETMKPDALFHSMATNQLSVPMLSLPSISKECVTTIPKTENTKDNTIKSNNADSRRPKTNEHTTESSKADVISFVKEKQMDIPLLNQTPILDQSSGMNQINQNQPYIKPEVSPKLEMQERNNLRTYELNKSSFTVAKHSTLPAQVQHITETKFDTKKDIPKVTTKVDYKPINNNHAAVPFGKWTEANRQEFLNKIKESKIPINVSNTNQIKQPNDLNRRDVLQKIDSQRQTNNAIALAKSQESKSQSNVKIEAKAFVNKSAPVSKESTFPIKAEQGANKRNVMILNKKATEQDPALNHPVLKDMPNTVFSSSAVTKKEPSSRKEINNQDLIDKTIEGIIINKVVLAKPAEDRKLDVSKTQNKTQLEQVTYSTTQQSKDSKPSTLDAIEIKMNELHGIPFVERPPHELPYRFPQDLHTYSAHDKSKSVVNTNSKIPTAVPIHNNREKTTNDIILDLDSEEEIIEFEPVTGDVALNKTRTEEKHPPAQLTSQAGTQVSSTDKSPIITENEFDKFARRTSITLDNCLSFNLLPNYKLKTPTESVVDKGIPMKKYSRNELLLAEAKVKSTNKQQQILRQNQHASKIQISSKLVPVTDEALNKNYHSKLQLAYQSALTAKRKKESPITIIEDKPVKVVFMDSNHEFKPRNLNVQGNQLSPAKKSLPEPESTNDSLDSEIDLANETKLQDDLKSKIKHQRKQVLTPVETPELELIEPKDLTLNDEGSPKKKRKLEDTNSEMSPKHLLTKKTYLLNRSTAPEENLSNQPSTSQSPLKETNSVQANTSTSHSDAASAIDNLVKAAELIENQSETLDTSIPSTSSATPEATPAKRGRGRPRKYPLPDGTPDKGKTPSPQKKPRLNNKKLTPTKDSSDSDSDDDGSSSEEGIARENWTMGKINENIVCPICQKLFRSENVVFKHVKHCSGPSPNRLGSGKKGRRKSRRSGEERKSRGSKSDDVNDEGKRKSKKGGTPKKSKSNDSNTAETTPPVDNKDEVIVVEDSPAPEKTDQQTPRRPGRPRIYPKDAVFECEFCGKQFKQMSYLVNHKLQHKKNVAKKDSKKTDEKDTVFSCEVCKKEFRKLHHLVQHRLIHNSNDGPSKPVRKTSSEQSFDKNKDQDVAKQDDQNAAFRCEPCDKSFRKLHHLVEHRETHDGINRQKVPVAAATDDKPASSDPPQCDVCNKTFRKLHHLVEHKEQHNDANSDKSDDKSVKSSLSTKDIIHECSLCYMVFPNEHSLNKHTINCQKKKKQAAEKQKVIEDQSHNEETSVNLQSNTVEEPQPKTILIEEEEVPKVETKKVEDIFDDTSALEDNMKISEILQKRLLNSSESKPVESVETKAVPTKRESISTDIKEPHIPAKVPKLDEKTKDKIPAEETAKIKPLQKEKIAPTVTKKRKSSSGPLTIVKTTTILTESSDDDEARYMLNPEYKTENECESAFMEVRANKRNSLQIERSNPKDPVKRRTSLQHAPKVPRLKPKPIEVRIPSSATSKPKLDSVSSIDSDDSDVKYSFPSTVENTKEESKEVKPAENTKTPKQKKIALINKRKTLTSIAKRKSLGKAAVLKKDKPTSAKQIKRRTLVAEHRCDCGALFSSAALLARHTSLAHTPPRRRPHRSPLPPKPRKSTPRVPDKPPAKTTDKQSTKTTDKPSRTSSNTDKPKPAAGTRKSSTNDKLKTATATRNPSTSDKPKLTSGSRKSSTNENKVAESRKSNTTDKIKTTTSSKSSVNEKPKPTPRKTSVNKKTKSVDSRKSSANDKPKAADSRKSSVNDKLKPADTRKSLSNKSQTNAEDATPKRKSVGASGSSKRTIIKARRAEAHRGVPVPEKLKKLLEKTPDKKLLEKTNSEDATPKRKSVRVSAGASSSLKRTMTKARRDEAHRGVPVPEKLKKLMEKNKK